MRKAWLMSSDCSYSEPCEQCKSVELTARFECVSCRLAREKLERMADAMKPEPTPPRAAVAPTMSCVYSIRNHLGHEVGTVETEGDAIAAYACKVNAPSSRLRAAGYKAIPLHNELARSQSG